MQSNRIAKCLQGSLRGVPGRNPEITVFRGVPYARPPVEELRWRAPQPPQRWYGVRDAGRFPAMAVQAQGFFGSAKGAFEDLYMSEDCLYLNIWTPARRSDDKLAVLVWIHGGAFQGGMAHEAIFDGERLAAKGVVVVTVGYRVGIMGFYCHPGMREEAPRGASGNFGLMDQAAALQWVRRNIAAFGGDPEKVTLAGQSAGGMSVCGMMCSPLAAGLFRAAICQSGDATLDADAETMEGAEQRGLMLARHFGAGTLDEMRKVPADALVRADYDAAKAVTGHWFRPVVDGAVAPRPQRGMALSGEAATRVPLIVGCNADDMGNPEQWFARIRHWALVRAREFHAPTWQYRFTRSVRIGGKEVGAVHSAEIPFVFQNFDLIRDAWPVELREGDWALSELMSDYWVNFVQYGDPNGEGLPRWAEKSPANSHMRFDTQSFMDRDDFSDSAAACIEEAERDRT